MLQTTLSFIFNEEWQILLCEKKRGFGTGKWNGAGGKQAEWESIENTAIREFLEETWVTIPIEQLQKKWILHFWYESRPEWNQSVHIFIWKEFNGTPSETEEVKPQWWDTNALPIIQCGKMMKYGYQN